MFLVNIQQVDQPNAEGRQSLLDAARERATSELKDEFANMACHLDALAGARLGG
jgi:hypothetical protein